MENEEREVEKIDINEDENLVLRLEETITKEKITYDRVFLKKCIDYAQKVYGDSKRHKGETTFEHSIKIATIVATLKIGIEPIYAGILHEVYKFKHKGYSEKEFKDMFGSEVTNLVIDYGKLTLLNYTGQEEIEAENLRKMFMALAKDVRVVIIKLADRLYNMRNIFEEPREVQELKAKESMEVYAPIAHRLGMSAIKSELEDISFEVLYKEEYEHIKKEVERTKESREEYINDQIRDIKEILKEEDIEASVYGRPKYYYSIYKKIKRQQCRVNDLFDLYAVRIIVNSVKDCYTVLGIIHEKYKPMPGRFKDYIAVPKTNMYQSLHTAVFGKDGDSPFEVQIRTWDMHKVADYGVAAHFLYKEGKSKISAVDEQFIWLRKNIELDQNMDKDSETYSNIKLELFGDEVFVFTPNGEIKSFPKGSTPIDFAYHIHQHIGDSMIGAKINSRIVPITTKLKNTDIVEIITSKTSNGPSLDWIKSVKTNNARSKIISFLKKRSKEENILKGQELFEKEISREGYLKDNAIREKYIAKMLKRYNMNKIEECYENIGFGALTAKKAVNKILDEYRKDNIEIDKLLEKDTKGKITLKNSKISGVDGIEVEGIDNCLVKLSNCCSPVPGDDIVGYISFGKGVAVHRSNCIHLSDLNLRERQINVKWREKQGVSYSANIRVRANDRAGITMDILKKLQEYNINVTSFKSRQTDNRECNMDLTVTISSLDEIQKIMRVIKKVDSVFDVRRAKQ